MPRIQSDYAFSQEFELRLIAQHPVIIWAKALFININPATT
jgi:hypothetical protein